MVQLDAEQKEAIKNAYLTNLAHHVAPDYVRYSNILQGYRSGGSYLRCLLALFELHTETMNAWTMIGIGGVSVSMLTSFLALEGVPWTRAIPFCALTASALLHMPFSVGFHLFRGINVRVYNQWRKLDQAFIFIASLLTCLAMGYYVLPWWGIVLQELCALGVVIGACRDIMSLSPDFRRKKEHMVRFVGSIVMCYWLPMALQAAFDLWQIGITLPVLYAVGVILALGLGGQLYAAGLPESAWPGKFDIWFSSHQLMHWSVLIAHVLEFQFLVSMYERQKTLPQA